MGTCYTFNHPDVENDIPVNTPLVQKLAGPQFGLKLLLDLQQVKIDTFSFPSVIF